MKTLRKSAVAEELAIAGFTNNHIRRCTQGELKFSEKMRVSATSRFGDARWSFRIPGNVRHAAVSSHALEILWPNKTRYENLSRSVVEGIKAGTLVRALMHGALRETVTRAKEVLNFLSFAVQLKMEKGGQVELLSNLSVEDLRSAVARYPFSRRSLDKHAKRLIYFMAEPWVGKYFPGGPVGWKRSDLDTLDWRNYRKKPTRPKQILPAAFFRDRSELCRALVHDFLVGLKIEAEDEQFDNDVYQAMKNGRQTIDLRYPDFDVAYQYYVQLMTQRRRLGLSHVEYVQENYNKRKFSLTIDSLAHVLRRSRYAAQNLIFLYTGMRGCEGRTLRLRVSDDYIERMRGCLLVKDGRHYLVGTVTKGRTDDSPINVDSWVAIDCMRDAVRLLAKQYEIGGNVHLISGLHRRGKADTAAGAWHATNNASFLRPEFQGTRWKTLIDEYDGNITEYSDRHTLVAELSRLGVGLIAITRQLHHLGGMLQNARVSDVATAYGELGLSSSSVVLNRLHDHEKAVAARKRDEESERTVGIFREGAKLAGPAAEMIKEEIEARFAGMGLEGEARERYVQRMAREGFVLPPTVDGFRCAFLSFTQNDSPGCINGSGCDVDCENLIIDETQGDRLVKEYSFVVRQLHNRAQFANCASLVHQEAEYAKFLRQLGKRPEVIKREVEVELGTRGRPVKEGG
ncbi:MAG: hypothetical protein HY308_10205 [Gammaproteobacteria bacterium]|nr:hypothetical protein [Gammaproteobacteria bacterium]